MHHYYNGAFICGGDHGVTIAATREEVVIKWLDYVYSLVIRDSISIWWFDDRMLGYNNYYTLRGLTDFDSVEVWRQVRQWSHYDEIYSFNSEKLKDRPISHWVKRSKLRKVALLLNMRCDVMSMVARKLLTKS